MIEVIKNSLGFDVPIKVYASIEEADTVAGRQGAVLDECNQNLWYRGAAAEAREIIAQVVEAETGVERPAQQASRKKKEKGPDGVEKEVTVLLTKRETRTNDDGTTTEIEVPQMEYTQDEDDYVKYALAKSNRTIESLVPAVQAAIRASNEGSGVAVDIKTRVRKAPQPKTLPSRYLEVGKKAVASGKVDQVAKDYLAFTGKTLASEKYTDPVAIGWAIKDIVDEQTKRAATAYSA